MPTKDGFEFQESDLEILNYTYTLRITHIEHLIALTARSKFTLWRRLPKLLKHRYLAVVRKNFLQKKIYELGSQGAEALVRAGYAPENLREHRLRQNEKSDFGIAHSLFIADIHQRLILGTRSGPVRIAAWAESTPLWDSVADRPGEKRRPVRPDAYFVLEHADRPEGKNRFHIFLEADRSTMSHAAMAQKITAYLAYYEQGLHAKKYPGMNAFLVATVTRTRKRAIELRNDLHALIPHVAWRQAYPFIAFEDLTLDSLLPKAPAPG